MKILDFNFPCKNPNGSLVTDEGKEVNVGQILANFLLHPSFKESDAISKFTLAGKITKEFEADDPEYDIIKKLLDSKLLPPIFEANIRIYLNTLKT